MHMFRGFQFISLVFIKNNSELLTKIQEIYRIYSYFCENSNMY